MSHARQNQQWDHTSSLMAWLATMMSSEGKAADPRWFRPGLFGGVSPKPKPKLSVDTMIAAFGL